MTEVSVAFTLKGLHSHTGHEPETSLRGGHVLPEGRGWREVVTEKAHAARGSGFLRQRRLPCDLRRSDSCTDVPGVWQPLGSGDRRGARGSRGEGAGAAAVWTGRGDPTAEWKPRDPPGSVALGSR